MACALWTKLISSRLASIRNKLLLLGKRLSRQNEPASNEQRVVKLVNIDKSNFKANV